MIRREIDIVISFQKHIYSLTVEGAVWTFVDLVLVRLLLQLLLLLFKILIKIRVRSLSEFLLLLLLPFYKCYFIQCLINSDFNNKQTKSYELTQKNTKY